MTRSIILTIALTTLLATACGTASTPNAGNSANTGTNPAPKTETAKTETKVDDSKWTAQDKDNAVKNCKFGRQKDDPAKVEKMCGCYLNKVIALSPNPADQGKIPMAEVSKLNNDCRVEAGL